MHQVKVGLVFLAGILSLFAAVSFAQAECGLPGDPVQVADNSTNNKQGTINDLGERVWSERDMVSGEFRLQSSTRGLLLSNTSVQYNMPDMNNYGTVVYNSYDYDSSMYRVYLYDGGTPAFVASDGWITALNDSGEIVYIASDGNVYSTWRGMLSDGTGGCNHVDINNAGDVVWAKWSNVYRRNVADSAGVVVYTSAGSVYEVSISNSGEVVWSENDGTGQWIYSDQRGQLTSTCPLADKHMFPEVNACGTVVFTTTGPDGEFLYQLGDGSACITPPMAPSMCEADGNAVQVVDSTILSKQGTINDLGERVWSDYNQSSGEYQLQSSTRGVLLSNISSYYMPDVNNYGMVVYGQHDSYDYKVYLYDGGTPEVVAFGTIAALNDSGEVIYIGSDNNVYSTLRGMLNDGTGECNHVDINNAGDVVWTKGAEVYRRNAADTGGAIMYIGAGPVYEVSISNAGEVVWSEHDGMRLRIHSDQRGQLTFTCPLSEWHMTPEVNACGTVVFTTSNPDGESLYQLGDSASCLPDEDSDGVPDILDNCQTVANPDQSDVNSNGIGDACDVGSDSDGDGISDADEVASGLDPGNLDTDGDELADGADWCPQGNCPVQPNVLLLLNNDHTNFYQGYSVDTIYNNLRDYVGYFDAHKYYSYSVGTFFPEGQTGASHYTPVGSTTYWSGNFLNWMAMSHADFLRKTLTGGKRSVDSTTGTSLIRANIPDSAHEWSKQYAGADLDRLVPLPYANPTYKFRNYGEVFDVYTSTNTSVTKNRPFTVRVEVCQNTMPENNCSAYPSGFMKPEGLLQAYREQARFGLMTYSHTMADQGGVLRSRMFDISYEFSLVNGALNSSSDSIIGYINTFTAKGWDPLGEMYYEGLRYLRGNEAAQSAYCESSSLTIDDTYAVYGCAANKRWDDPSVYPDGAQPQFIVVVGDEYPSRDGDALPGNVFNTYADAPSNFGVNTLYNPDTAGLTNLVGDLEGVTNTAQYVANTLSDATGTCSTKTLGPLAETYGMCPSEPTSQGTYYLSGLSFDGFTADQRPDQPGRQHVRTYVVANRASPGGYQVPKAPLNPLWLAAKYGNFDDVNGNNLPDLPDEWVTSVSDCSIINYMGDANCYPQGFFVAEEGDSTQAAFASILADVIVRSANADGDNFPDETDNCPLVPNSLQADLDGDGIGDACDIEKLLEITLSGPGNGAVSDASWGINCTSGTCGESVNAGSVVNLIATPQPGSVFVGWLGSCSGSEPVCSLTVDTLKEAIAVFKGNVVLDAPLAGSLAPEGSPLAIHWTLPANGVYSYLRYSLDGGASWNFLRKLSGGVDNFLWTLPLVDTFTPCLLKVTVHDAGDNYLGDDIIDTPLGISDTTKVAVSSPNGGETLTAGQTVPLSWSPATGATYYYLRYSTDGGSSWTFIKRVDAATTYDWKVPYLAATSNNCLLKVVAHQDSDLNYLGEDISDGTFTIDVPTVAGVVVTSPDGGEILTVGANVSVTWDAVPTAQIFHVRLSTDGGATWNYVKKVTGGATSFVWKVPAVGSSNCLLKVTAHDVNDKYIAVDVSDAVFLVQ